MNENENKEIREYIVRRRGKRDLSFRGTLLAEKTDSYIAAMDKQKSDRNFGALDSVFSIFSTESGKYIVAYFTSGNEYVDVSDEWAVVVESHNDITKEIEGYFKYMPTIAKQTLKAAKLDQYERVS